MTSCSTAERMALVRGLSQPVARLCSRWYRCDCHPPFFLLPLLSCCTSGFCLQDGFRIPCLRDVTLGALDGGQNRDLRGLYKASIDLRNRGKHPRIYAIECYFLDKAGFLRLNARELKVYIWRTWCRPSVTILSSSSPTVRHKFHEEVIEGR